VKCVLGIARWLAAIVGVVVVVWGLGLAWFLYLGLWGARDRGAPTDAIVVLTGGRFRLESGLDLLEAGKAGKLFISGVNQHVDREAILRAFGPLPESAACCIVLGHSADNTEGNARETAAWMKEEDFRSLRLVTSWYHMPRSRLEFARAMGEVTIVPHPVFPPHPGVESWSARAHAAHLLVNEYHKYLAALGRPVLGPLLRRLPGSLAEAGARIAERTR